MKNYTLVRIGKEKKGQFAQYGVVFYDKDTMDEPQFVDKLIKVNLPAIQEPYFKYEADKSKWVAIRNQLKLPKPRKGLKGPSVWTSEHVEDSRLYRRDMFDLACLHHKRENANDNKQSSK